MHETTLITTLVASLVCAFLGGLAASKLRLPPIVGYLLAGVAIGPNTPGFVADQALAMQLAEVGVILLMFGVGLHFSLQDLRKVWRVATMGAIGQMTFATFVATLFGIYWGWKVSESLMFGLALSVASTVVLLRALDARKSLHTPHGQVAVGWLVVEDIAMIMALFFLPSLVGILEPTTSFSESEIMLDDIGLAVFVMLGKIALFALAFYVVGRKVIPAVLAYVDKLGSRELFTLSVLAIALGVAYGASVLFDISFALGAFIAGMVMHESDFSHRAAKDSLPFQDAFAVLFFVAVGMLFDPSILVTQPMKVLVVVGIIVFGKFLAAVAIMRLFRYPFPTSCFVGASLAQIGEFSFILVAVGISLGVMHNEARDLVLAGSLLSIALNQTLFYAVEKFTPKTKKKK